MILYVDDTAILHKSDVSSTEITNTVKNMLFEIVGLKINTQKTQTTENNGKVEWLGQWFN